LFRAALSFLFLRESHLLALLLFSRLPSGLVLAQKRAGLRALLSLCPIERGVSVRILNAGIAATLDKQAQNIRVTQASGVVQWGLAAAISDVRVRIRPTQGTYNFRMP